VVPDVPAGGGSEAVPAVPLVVDGSVADPALAGWLFTAPVPPVPVVPVAVGPAPSGPPGFVPVVVRG